MHEKPWNCYRAEKRKLTE